MLHQGSHVLAKREPPGCDPSGFYAPGMEWGATGAITKCDQWDTAAAAGPQNTAPRGGQPTGGADNFSKDLGAALLFLLHLGRFDLIVDVYLFERQT